MRNKSGLSLIVVCVSYGVAAGVLSAAPKPTPTPDIPSRIRAYKAAHPGVLEVGSGVSEPRELSRIRPVYPEAPRKQRLSLGPIVLIAVITEAGTVEDPVLISSASPELDAAFMKAARQWHYGPARLKGKPVAVFLTTTVSWLF